jgi:hypothetical protein
MSETQGGHGSMSVGETNKLVGSSNYHIWQFKMKVILRRENVWDFVQTHIQPDSPLIIVLGSQYTRQTMRKTKSYIVNNIIIYNK